MSKKIITKKFIPGQSSISEEITKLLNYQIGLEANASAKYLAMAAWCSAKGYDNSTDFFFNQSEEERQHMLKIFKYMCDMGADPVSPTIAQVEPKFDSLKDVFITALQSEMHVSESINNIVDQARAERDYPTEQILQWFVEEQVEEEYNMRRAVELFDLLGEDKLAIFMIDERIPKIQYSNPHGTDTEAAQ